MTKEEMIQEIENIRKFNYTLAPEEVFDMVREALKKFKEGHWIIWDTSSHDWTYKCSECKCIEKRASIYCPNCGAKMKGDE